MMVMEDEPGAIPKPGLRGRILVIEDEPAVLNLVVEVLNDLGYAVRGAEDGVAGLTILRSGEVDLLVTDIRLPGLSGFAVAKAARLLHPDLRILFMSGFGGSADEREELADVEILSKPFSMEDLALRAAKMIGAAEIS